MWKEIRSLLPELSMSKHTDKLDKEKKNGNLKLTEVEDEGPKRLHCSGETSLAGCSRQPALAGEVGEGQQKH